MAGHPKAGLKPPRNAAKYLSAKDLDYALHRLIVELAAQYTEGVKMRASITVYAWDPIWETDPEGRTILTSQTYIVENRK
jgi:hypothetical protein